MQGWYQMNIKKLLILASLIISIFILIYATISNSISDRFSFSKEYVSNIIITGVSHGPDGKEELLITNNNKKTINLKSNESYEIDFLLPLFTDIDYPALLFETDAKNLSIFLDDELILKQESPSLLSFDKYPIMLTFDKEDSLSTLKIIIYNKSNNSGSFFIKNFIFGDNYTLLYEYILHDILFLSIFISLLGISLITIFISKLIPSNIEKQKIITLCNFIFFNALFQLSICDSIYFFFNKPLIMKLFTNFILSMIPFYTYKFVENNILVNDDKKLLNYLKKLTLISPILYILLVSLDLFSVNLYESLFTIYILLFLIVLIIFIFIVQNKNKNTNKVLLLLFVLFETCFIIQRLFDLHRFYKTQILELLLIVCLLVITIYTILSSLKQKPSDILIEDSFYDTFTDPLTNLLNRSAFEERIFALDNDRKNDWYVITIDIDFMKVCNDTLGHAAGDELLTNFSKALSNQMSPYEGLAFRTGGDEFVVIIKRNKEFDITSFISKLEKEYANSSSFKNSSFSYGYNLYRHNSGVKFLDSLRTSDEQLLINKASHHKKLINNDGFSKSDPKH